MKNPIFLGFGDYGCRIVALVYLVYTVMQKQNLTPPLPVVKSAPY